MEPFIKIMILGACLIVPLALSVWWLNKCETDSAE